MKLIDTPIADLYLIQPQIHRDNRGYFMEAFKNNFLKENKLDYNFIQDNQAQSIRGVIRGIHFQKNEYAQAKLICVIEGEIQDVAVDIRKESATYGQSYSVILSAHNHKQLLIPRGMAHGYAVLSETATVLYKIDNPYAPLYESGIRYNDRQLNIDWMLHEHEMIISEKDLQLGYFDQL